MLDPEEFDRELTKAIKGIVTVSLVMGVLLGALLIGLVAWLC